MSHELMLIGTHRRSQHADAEDSAFGIYGLRLSAPTDRSTLLVETPQPGWIVVHPSGTVYAVNEVKHLGGHDGGAISAFRWNDDGEKLIELNSRILPAAPCHCAIDHSGEFLLAATFGGGSVHLFPILEDGSIGPEADAHYHSGSSVHPRRQTQPHAHGVTIHPANRLVLVPDLGTDRLLIYVLDPVRRVLIPQPDAAIVLPPGSGPRHAVFDVSGRFAYLINEMNASVMAFSVEIAEDRLQPLQTVDLLPDGFVGLRSGAAIGLHAETQTLYATTRSHGSSGKPPEPGVNTLVWFAVDPATGRLSNRQSVDSGGEIPRSFAFSCDGQSLLIGHQGTNCVVRFALDPETGRPSQIGDPISTPVPVCLCPVC